MALLRRFQLLGELLVRLDAGFQLALRRFERTLILLDGLLLQLEFLLEVSKLCLCPGGCVLEIGNARRGQLELGISFLQLLVYGTQVRGEIVAVQ